MNITIPMCIGPRPENSLGTFPEQLKEKIQFTFACFYTKLKAKWGQQINQMYLSCILCFRRIKREKKTTFACTEEKFRKTHLNVIIFLCSLVQLCMVSNMIELAFHLAGKQGSNFSYGVGSDVLRCSVLPFWQKKTGLGEGREGARND